MYDTKATFNSLLYGVFRTQYLVHNDKENKGIMEGFKYERRKQLKGLEHDNL